MRISILEKRENFSKIVCETLSSYWISTYGQPVIIKTKKSGSNSQNKLLYQHKFFNFIAKSNTPPFAYESLKKEYSKSNSFIKSILLKIYFKASISNWGLGFLSDTRYMVAPFIPEKDPFLIYGGNTRLRIVYPERNEVRAILKKGFDKENISNEINFRSKHNPKIAPDWLGQDKQGLWFSERYTPGFPINRLKDVKLQDKLRVSAILRLLNQVILPHNRSISFKNYMIEIIAEIRMISEDLKSKQLQVPINELVELIERSTDGVTEGMIIYLSQSHGDCQDANILSTPKGLKIIDWETVYTRSITYDIYTYLFGSRKTYAEGHKVSINSNLVSAIKPWYLEQFSIDISPKKSPYLLMWAIEELKYAIKSKCEPIYKNVGDGLPKKIVDIRTVLEQFCND